MSVSRLGSRDRLQSYTWPGFVDALASLLMVFVFVLMVFVLIQANLAYRLSGKDASLSALQSELATISNLLGKERDETARLSSALSSSNDALKQAQDDILNLSSSLAKSEASEASQLAQLQALNAQLTAQAARNDSLRQSLDDANQALDEKQIALLALQARNQALMTQSTDLSDNLTQTQAALATQEELTQESKLEIERLIAATLTLRNELNELRALLAEKEAQSLADKVTIASLGKSLNEALASRVQELQRFKSDFFGRLRDILGSRGDVTIVGDRFIFQSEVLFDQGRASLGEDGSQQLQQIGDALLEISKDIPADIPWILQVDGHTDDVPVAGVYADNWQLSTERALSVVRYLIDYGVPADKLAATGYGEFQPIAKGTSIDARRRNRRIELKFTQRLSKD